MVMTHGAYVWCQYNYWHVKVWNLYTLPGSECIWLHCRNETSYFGTFVFFGINWQNVATLLFEIKNKWSWGFCAVPLFTTVMWKNEICTIYHTKNAFGYISATKHRFLRILWFFGVNLQDAATMTFETDGHGAYVWCQYNYWHVKGWNMYPLSDSECIWLHCRNETSFLGLLCFWGEN